MIGIVPAAGMGRRLGQTYQNLPKPLVEVGGSSLISRVLRRLDALEIDSLLIVLGYMGDRVRDHIDSLNLDHRVDFLENDLYETTNNLYTLSLTIPFWGNGFIVSDSDLLTSRDVLKRLCAVTGSGILVDRSRSQTFDLGAHVAKGRVTQLSKDVPRAVASGEGLGMSIWRAPDAAILAREVRRMLREGGEDLWYPYAMSAAAQHVRLLEVPVTSKEWWEVDTHADLEEGQRLAANNPLWAI